jgi:hypothetical protein
MTTLGLDRLPGRCSGCGFHVETQGCRCEGSEWAIFRAALLASVDATGLIHQSAMRPKIRGRIHPRHIGTCYRRAKAEGLIVDTGEREPSNDVAGRNGDKLDRVYRLVTAERGAA